MYYILRNGLLCMTSRNTKVQNTKLICIFFVLTVCIFEKTYADYWSDRAKLIQTESSEAVGGKLTLNKEEMAVNELIMQHKCSEVDSGFKHPSTFLPAQHFFKSKPLIEKSDLFKIIRRLPKGASLHAHEVTLTSFEFLYNLTFSENLYGCVDKEGKLHFAYPGNLDSQKCKWELIQLLRKQNSSFDGYLKSQLCMIVDDPEKTYYSVNAAWKVFQGMLDRVTELIAYKPVFVEYFYQALKELLEDNVFYLELRTSLPAVHDSSGKKYTPKEVVQIYLDTLNKFRKDNPEFLGARLIYTPIRKVDNSTMKEYVRTAHEITKINRGFVIGFDLEGQEDAGEPLISFIPYLREIAKETQFFFHAGETKWNGLPTDFNLIDAVLLNTKRIGHGYDLLKHPEALRIVKQQKIAIEVNPLSNQVLGLVHDMRNHPGSVFMNMGYPVVICSDAPTFWGARALSYDWYMAFVGMSSRQSDLRLLKQLALNSIHYSSMTNTEKKEAVEKWKGSWNKFLKELSVQT